MLHFRTCWLVLLVAHAWGCGGPAGSTDRWATVGASSPDAGSHRGTDGGGTTADVGLEERDAGEGAAPQGATIAASETTTCARFGDDVCCWGDVGDVSIAAPTPVPLPGPPSDIAVLGGSSDQMSACALVADQVYCWTYSADGTPKVENLAGAGGVVQIVASDRHACALRVDRRVLCWGADNVGQLGRGAIYGNGPYPPDFVSGLTKAVEVAVGSNHSCARLVSGKIECWGNGYGMNTCPGDNACPSGMPVAVELPAPATRVSAGGVQTCVQAADGTVYCWKLDGRLTIPAAVPPIAGADAVQPGYALSCAIPPDHRPICWGSNGILAPSTVDYARIDGFDDIVEYASGWYHACGRTEAGQIVCFGDNSKHQLGDGGPSGFSTPQPVECSKPSRH